MKTNDMCLKCKHLDTSDIPNLFCNLTCELVNETEFEYCPKDTACVVAYVENLKSQIELLKAGAEKGILKRDFDLLVRNKELMQQVEIWKKACELACAEIPDADNFFEFNGITKQDDFYDRASKMI